MQVAAFESIELDVDTGFAAAIFNLGFLVKPPDKPVSFGARYQSRQKVELEELDLTSTQIATNLRTSVPRPGIPAGRGT